MIVNPLQIWYPDKEVQLGGQTYALQVTAMEARKSVSGYTFIRSPIDIKSNDMTTVVLAGYHLLSYGHKQLGFLSISHHPRVIGVDQLFEKFYS